MTFIRWERRHCADPLETRLFKGGGGGPSNSASLTTITTNEDSRAVLQDSVQVGDGSSSTVSTNTWSYTEAADAKVLETLANALPDAVSALGQMSATTLRDVGGSIVNLNKDSQTANSKAWDSTLEHGASTVDKAIDLMEKSFGFVKDSMTAQTDFAQKNIASSNALAGKSLDAYQPTDSKNADLVKYAMFAAAAVAAVVLLKDAK
jgi:hypothetical protein